MHRLPTTRIVLALLALSVWQPVASGDTHRLYDGIVRFIHNAKGEDFTITLDVRDANHIARGPAEILVKVYHPDGSLAVREVIEDDGILANTHPGPIAGYDHDAWYYSTTYSRGVEPAVRWSAWTEPARVAAMPKRTFTYRIEGGGAGVYRVVLVGSPDHIITLATDPDLPSGVSASPDFMHGCDDRFKRSSIYVPRGTQGLSLAILQMDRPADRTLRVMDAAGKVLASTHSRQGYGTGGVRFDNPDAFADQVLTVEVSDGPGAYLFSVFLDQPRGARYGGRSGRVFAALCPDAATARALRNGAIYHDGQTYWHTYQVRLHDWLKTLKPEDFQIPKDLARNPRGFISLGSHERPRDLAAENSIAGVTMPHSDQLMHDYVAHKNRQVLNAAIRELHEGMSRIGPEDHVMRGRNLAYEMGSYSFFYIRPAWRILQQSDAPDQVKDAIRQFVIQTGDRLAFARGIEMVNGNALASLTQNLRYAVEATGDELQKRLFETYWKRFTTGGFHDRIGVGPSGGVQESFGYDYHYGSYVLRGYLAGIADLGDQRFVQVRNGILEMYSYAWAPENLIGGAWSSRTSINVPGGGYSPADGAYPWKGLPGPAFTVSVRNANEFFAARRGNYYALTYFGRITPSWLGEGFHGQVGYSGGMLNTLQVPDHGPVIISRLHGSYGQGMHRSNWRNFAINSIVGTLSNGEALVTADSEHHNARLEGTIVRGSADVRRSPVHITRQFTFHDGYLECLAQLSPSTNDAILGLWGGLPEHRAAVTEAYEMIPLLGFKVNRARMDRPDDAIDLVVLDEAGKQVGVASDKPVTGSAVVLDRGGFGVVVKLDRPRALTRGHQGTLLIELAKGRTAIGDVGITYQLLPFIGSPEKAGTVSKAKILPLAKLAQDIALDKVAEALAAAPVHEVAEGKLARLSLGIAGKELAVTGEVFDKLVQPHDVPWRGSCIEVFGSMPGKEKIGQIFLTPSAGDRPAKAYRAQGERQLPEPGIRLQTQPIDGGYRFQALIPLELLALEPGAETMALEFQVNAAPDGRTHVRNTLFGSRLAYAESYRYGLFSTEVKAEESAR